MADKSFYFLYSGVLFLLIWRLCKNYTYVSKACSHKDLQPIACLLIDFINDYVQLEHRGPILPSQDERDHGFI